MPASIQSITRLFALLFALLLFLVGCNPTQYGVVLWPSEENVSTSGELVRIRGIEEQQQQVSVQNSTTQERIELWRVALFNDLAPAQQFQQQFDTYKHHYARCERKALPIRLEPNRFSEILYRLDRGERLKILGRIDELQDEGGFQDYWYQVLAQDGTRGWVFGYYLTVFDAETDSIATGSEVDTNIAFFLNNVWRPEYFVTMISDNAFDLSIFSTTIGLFPVPLENRITLNLPHRQYVVTYEVPIPVSDTQFSFTEAEKSITIEVRSASHVTVSWGRGDEALTADYYIVNESIQAIVQRVTAERSALLNQVLSLSQVSHPGYGTITFGADTSFRWTTMGALSAYRSSSAPNGRVSIDLELGSRLANYDGVLSFYFASGEVLHFAFALNQGLTLSLVPPSFSGYIANTTVGGYSQIRMQ